MSGSLAGGWGMRSHAYKRRPASLLGRVSLRLAGQHRRLTIFIVVNTVLL